MTIIIVHYANIDPKCVTTLDKYLQTLFVMIMSSKNVIQLTEYTCLSAQIKLRLG